MFYTYVVLQSLVFLTSQILSIFHHRSTGEKIKCIRCNEEFYENQNIIGDCQPDGDEDACLSHLPDKYQEAGWLDYSIAYSQCLFALVDKVLELYFLFNPQFPALWRAAFFFFMILPLLVMKPMAYFYIFGDKHLMGSYYGLLGYFSN